jgi:hypothetical protein
MISRPSLEQLSEFEHLHKWPSRLIIAVARVLQRGPKLLWEVPLETGGWAVARKTRYRDVTVGLFVLGAESPVALEHVMKALDIVADGDPRRFARIRHDRVRVLVEDGPVCCYRWLTNTCVLTLDAVRNDPPQTTALTIIHEATHARLYRAGVGHDRKNKARQERRCVLEEIAFLRRLASLGYRGTDPWSQCSEVVRMRD